MISSVSVKGILLPFLGGAVLSASGCALVAYFTRSNTNEESNEEINELKAEKIRLTAENKKLKEEDIKELETQKEGLEKQIEDLGKEKTKEIQEKDKKIKELETQKAGLEKQIKNLEEEVKKLKEDKKNSEADEKDKKIKELETQKAGLEKQIEDLGKEKTKEIQEKDKKIKELETQKAGLEKQIKNLKDKKAMEDWRQENNIKWLNKHLEKRVIEFVKEKKESFLDFEKVSVDEQGEIEKNNKKFIFNAENNENMSMLISGLFKDGSPSISVSFRFKDEEKNDNLWICDIDAGGDVLDQDKGKEIYEGEKMKEFLKKFGLSFESEKIKYTFDAEVNKNIKGLLKNCLKAEDFSSYNKTKTIRRTIYIPWDKTTDFFKEEKINNLFNQ